MLRLSAKLGLTTSEDDDMEMINRAIDDADRFKDMMRKVSSPEAQRVQAITQQTREVQEWNAEVERKRYEKHMRKLLKAAER